MTTTAGMVPICPISALVVDRGAAALLPDGTQIGVFRLEDGSVHAVQQRDPYSGANILSRGLVGSHLIPGQDGTDGAVVPTLSSPMYKQVWNLDTGEVIDAGGGDVLPIEVFDVEIRDGQVQVAATARPRTESGDA